MALIKEKIDLTIGIPLYNASNLIERCIDSILSQKTQYTFEIIIVDDGSTDDSLTYIKKYDDKRIHLYKQENAGPSKARNKTIKEAKGKYFAFLDADDYWLPNYIEETISFLESNSQCIAVSVGQKHFTVSGEKISPTYLFEENSYKEPFIINDFYTFWSEYFHICTGSIVISTEIVKSTEGQREELRICEDLEFWGLLASYGKFGLIPQILFVSDGLQTIEKNGWLNKNIKRWNSAPTTADWEKRIIKRFGDNIPQSYIKARGIIAQNLSYSMILSKRYNLARKEILKYGNDFPIGRMKNLLTLSAKNSIIWYITTRLLVYREYNRKL